MPTLRKRTLKNGSHVWFIDFYHNGRRHRRSTGTADKALATKILKKIEGDLVSERFGFEFPRSSVSLKEFAEAHLEHAKINKAHGTFRGIRNSLRKFHELTGNKSIRSITPADAENYKNSRIKSVKKDTVNTEIRWLKAAFARAVKLEYIERNPFRDVQLFRIDQKTPVFLNIEEIDKFLSVMTKRDHKTFFQFLLYTGCRREEALKITWDKIDIEGRKIKIIAKKTGKLRTIPIGDRLLEILKEHKAGQKGSKKLFNFGRGTVFYVFHKYKKLARIEKYFNLHSLRHTFASHLVMNGVSLYAVKEFLGHSTIKMTEIYAHLSPDYLAEEIKKLPY